MNAEDAARDASMISHGTTIEAVGRGHRASTRRGDLAWVGSHGAPIRFVGAAAMAAIRGVASALEGVDFELTDLVRIGVYHDRDLEDADVRQAVRAALPAGSRPVVTFLPVREPALPGAAVIVDGTAARGSRSQVGEADFPAALRVGNHVWVGGLAGSGSGILAQTRDVLDGLRAILTASGAQLDDAVKVNISYVGDGTESDWEPTAKLRGAAFREPAAAATGIPFPRLPGGVATQIEMLAIAGSTGTRRHGWPEGHWDWPIDLPWKHGCRAGDLVTVGGQVSLDGRGLPIDPGDLAQQTETALQNIDRVLATVGARMADVVQVTAFFEGSPDDLETLLTRTRRAFGAEPPPIVPVPLPYLAYRGMVVEIEVIAVVPAPEPVSAAASP